MIENSPSTEARRSWMNALARSKVEDLEAAWRQKTLRPSYQILRGPETGLVMVQARSGGSGRRFNLGEMTITRCTLQTQSGFIGHAYVAGRSLRKAELAAAFDALLQDPAQTDRLQREVVEPLVRNRLRQERAVAEKTAATKVDFFTMVRGDE